MSTVAHIGNGPLSNHHRSHSSQLTAAMDPVLSPQRHRHHSHVTLLLSQLQNRLNPIQNAPQPQSPTDPPNHPPPLSFSAQTPTQAKASDPFAETAITTYYLLPTTILNQCRRRLGSCTYKPGFVQVGFFTRGTYIHTERSLMHSSQDTSGHRKIKQSRHTP